MEIAVVTMLGGVVAAAAPLVLAAMGETLTEKAGVINLSLDGAILLAAMCGFAAASHTGSLAAGFAAAAMAGMTSAAVLAFIGIGLAQSQVAAGFALVFFCRDLAYFAGAPLARTAGPKLAPVPLPVLHRIPVLGEMLFSHTMVVYGSYAAVAGVWLFLYHTRAGLLARCAGENPEGCRARGVDPRLVRLWCTLAGGVLVGLSGAAFSLAVKPGWGRPQGCEGIGWIALALVVFGGWHPLRVACGAYFFALLQVLGVVLQDRLAGVPPQLFQVAPFPLMISALLLVGRARRNGGGGPPAALGK